ncbi:MAG: methylated-DNA--[protein]-cysteine S-methyltransferase [Ktedonobacteraceae bacterium]
MAVLQQSTKTLVWDSVASPMGECIILASDAGLYWVGTPGTSLDKGLRWAKNHGQSEHAEHATHPVLQQAKDELNRYFAGEKIIFSTSLDLQGTPFQVSVWHELCNIPYGETRSYGEIALAIGHPTASRAVGAANGANPIAIIVPCHRVIGSNGTLTGYGGGLPTKSWLLKLEGVSHHA